MTSDFPPSLVDALSLERFARYVDWAGGNESRALHLYTLNTQLSEALYTPLQMLEVALRNRIHAVMSASRHDRWFEEAGFLKIISQPAQVAKATADVTDGRKDATPGRVVAALTFGFWTSMLAKEYEDLWQMTLHRIAKREDGKGLRRKDLSTPLNPIRTLRNRVAHHEPIIHWDLRKHYANMLQVTEWLSPAAAAWCRQYSRFPAVHPPERPVLA
ncbi:MAG: Abi family protein [Rhodospirillaceae bacterium]|nr:Abi family protein [Rhodospirillaceae bacterium]